MNITPITFSPYYQKEKYGVKYSDYYEIKREKSQSHKFQLCYYLTAKLVIIFGIQDVIGKIFINFVL